MFGREGWFSCDPGVGLVLSQENVNDGSGLIFFYSNICKLPQEVCMLEFFSLCGFFLLLLLLLSFFQHVCLM